MSLQTVKKLGINKKIFLSIFFICLTIFVFTSDAHRYSGDEDWQNLQAIRMVTLEPHELYVDGESRIRFEYPVDYPLYWQGYTCHNYILCSPANIAASVTQVPFLFINHNFNIITDDTITWNNTDFNDLHYVFWRNSIDPDFTFLELFYGPLYSALSLGVFFLICRSFNYEIRTSLILTLLLGLTTPIWAYSQTSLSLVPFVFTLLLAFYFFRRFQKNDSALNLIFCAMCLGFGFMVREEMAMIIVILMGFFIYNLRKRDGKIKKILCYLVPQIIFYTLTKLFFYLSSGIMGHRIGTDISDIAVGLGNSVLTLEILLTREFALLFSPGLGLLFFAPILFTMFFAFPDFFKKHKPETVLILSIMTFFMIEMGSFGHWHGLVAWSARFIVPCIPFLLLPLGASIESGKSKKLMMLIILILGSLGFLINLAFVFQDVSWFVWGQAGRDLGLYSLGNDQTSLYINDVVIWSFEYSQLTNSITTLFTGFYPDIFLLKLMGPGIFAATIFSLLLGQVYFLYRILNRYKVTKPESTSRIS
tara:strand:+ start:83 stop:1681 length:1599 start_codon:yes stop_codon:yes gene_type:complete